MKMANRKTFSDRFSQAFLGDGPQTVQHDQTVDPEAQAAAYNGYLQDEAVELGDSFVQWVAAHKTIPIHARAWGFVLGTFCTRAEYPGGVAAFDSIVAAAGEDLDLPRKEFDPPNIPEWTTEAMHHATQFAELSAGYVSLVRRQRSISDQQAAYGIGRAWHNLRETFPQGGPVGFDVLAREAADYFAQHKNGA